MTSGAALKCAECDIEFDSDLTECPECGAKSQGRILTSMTEFVARIAKTTNVKLRVVGLVIVLFAFTMAVYWAFPEKGSIGGLISWQDKGGTSPIVGARVMILRNDIIVAEKLTDERGNFSISIPAGEVDLVVADLNSVKTGSNADYLITERTWDARFWKQHINVGRRKSVDLGLNNKSVSPPEIKYFSTSQLNDYRNREGWASKGPFTQQQIMDELKTR